MFVENEKCLNRRVVNAIILLCFCAFLMLEAGCSTTASAKKEEVFFANRLVSAGYSVKSKVSIKVNDALNSTEPEEFEAELRKSFLHVGFPFWLNLEDLTCYNISLSPLVSRAVVIRGVDIAPIAFAGKGYGFQCSIAGVFGEGHGLQLAALCCLSGFRNSLIVAPVSWNVMGGRCYQIGLLSLTMPPPDKHRGRYPSPALGQLSLINLSGGDHLSRWFHWQGGLLNLYGVEVGEDDVCRFLQIGLWNYINMEYDGKQDERHFSFQTQLGVVNYLTNYEVRNREWKFQCGIVNTRLPVIYWSDKRQSEYRYKHLSGSKEKFGKVIQFGIVNRSFIQENESNGDGTLQIGLVNIKDGRWSLFFNW